MKHFMFAAAVAATLVATPVLAANVGVSVSIGQPGFYGQIDIGNFPPPQVIYRQPVIIQRDNMGRPPVYLRVPPGHRKHWSRHCREYNACGERVYFVQDNWYEQQYVPRYQEQHREYRDQRGEGHEGDRGDRGDNNRGGDDHGRGDHGRGDHGRD